MEKYCLTATEQICKFILKCVYLWQQFTSRHRPEAIIFLNSWMCPPKKGASIIFSRQPGAAVAPQPGPERGTRFRRCWMDRSGRRWTRRNCTPRTVPPRPDRTGTASRPAVGQRSRSHRRARRRSECRARTAAGSRHWRRWDRRAVRSSVVTVPVQNRFQRFRAPVPGTGTIWKLESSAGTGTEEPNDFWNRDNTGVRRKERGHAFYYLPLYSF